jgi:ribosomal-protein-alanine N-acetyltransferase
VLRGVAEPNTDGYVIRLASARDAVHIAEMSRTLIEVGLGWSWTPKRVVRSLQHPEINVAVACDPHGIVGFGIARYRAKQAHIPLFAVDRAHRRAGIGTALIHWIEATALTAGIGVIYLEARYANSGARAFYRALGYREIGTVPGMYRGIETGVRLVKDLWVGSGPSLHSR